jgi:Ca2+-binding EF-hand superfamily protein
MATLNKPSNGAQQADERFNVTEANVSSSQAFSPAGNSPNGSTSTENLRNRAGTRNSGLFGNQMSIISMEKGYVPDEDESEFEKRKPKTLIHKILIVLGIVAVDLAFWTPGIYFTVARANNTKLIPDQVPLLMSIEDNIIRWSFWMGTIWAFHFTALFLLKVTPVLAVQVTGKFSRRISRKLSLIEDYISSIRPFVQFAMDSSASVITFRIFFAELIGYWDSIFKSLLVILVFSFCTLFQSIVIQNLVLKFHRAVYKDRIEYSSKYLSILERLNKYSRSIAALKNPQEAPIVVDEVDNEAQTEKKTMLRKLFGKFHKKSAGAMDNPAWLAQELLPKSDPDVNGSDFQIPTESNKNLERSSMTSTTDMNKSKRVSKSITNTFADDNAVYLARKIFKRLQISDAIHYSSIMQCFESNVEAQEVFQYFDLSGNGSIHLSDLERRVKTIFREKKRLNKALYSMSEALVSLNQILYCISIVVTFITAFPVFGIELSSIVPFLSILFALSFVFGGASSTTFTCIVFLFIIHPFDAGDRIHIDDKAFIVKHVSILTTTLTMEGKIFYMPNGNFI